MRDYAELVKGGTRIQLYRCTGKLLQERRSRVTTASPSGRLQNTEFADNSQRDLAFEARLRELLAEGWVDQRPPPARPSRKRSADTASLEEAFAALVTKTIRGLERASEANEAGVWRDAITTYGKLKVRAGGNRTENLVHFFAVDGIALERAHPVVVTKVRASTTRKRRWLQLLEAAR